MAQFLSWPRFHADNWLVDCFGLNSPLRQYFNLYWAVMQTNILKSYIWLDPNCAFSICTHVFFLTFDLVLIQLRLFKAWPRCHEDKHSEIFSGSLDQTYAFQSKHKVFPRYELVT